MIAHAGAGWRIRRMYPRDGAACIRIFTDCVKDQDWRGPVTKYLDDLRHSMITGHTFVAEEPSAGVVGFLTMVATTTYVDHLFVHPDWRFCGVARGLLEAARDDAGESLVLDVDQKNAGARAAYAALGWREVAFRPRTRIPGGQVRLMGP